MMSRQVSAVPKTAFVQNGRRTIEVQQDEDHEQQLQDENQEVASQNVSYL